MQITEATYVLTPEQRILADKIGKAYGEDQAKLDLSHGIKHEAMWVNGLWRGNAHQICGQTLTIEQVTAFKYLVDLSAQDAWENFESASAE